MDAENNLNISICAQTKLLNAYGKIHKLNDADINKAFIERGFSTIRYKVDFYNRYFGVDAMAREEVIINDANADMLAFMNQERERIQEELLGLNFGSDSNKNLWLEIHKNPNLFSETKLEFLSRFFPYLNLELNKQESVALSAAKEEEVNNICRLYRSPNIVLSGQNSNHQELMQIRKTVYNAVMQDAFLFLNFKKCQTKKGLVILEKKLSNSLIVRLETDNYQFARKYYTAPQYVFQDDGNSILVHQGSRLTLDNFTYIGLVKEKTIDKLISFGCYGYSFSKYLPDRYIDTCTLEIAIRARALWYELTVEPFEKEAIEIIESLK